MKYLFDTDHISVLHRGSGADFAVLAARMALHAPTDLAVSIVSFQEQVRGSHAHIAQAKTSADLVRRYGRLSSLLIDYSMATVLPFTAAAAAVLDGLRAQNVQIKAMDLRIASIALASSLTLLTRNLRDFQKVPGLVIEDWTK